MVREWPCDHRWPNENLCWDGYEENDAFCFWGDWKWEGLGLSLKGSTLLASEIKPGQQKLSRAGDMDGHPDSTGNPGVNHAWGCHVCVQTGNLIYGRSICEMIVYQEQLVNHAMRFYFFFIETLFH